MSKDIVLDELIALGASLRQAREARDLDLEELEKLTRIRLKYLEAMERGAFGEIDNPLQLKGFLRSYARAVELDPDAVLAHYERAYQTSQGKRGRRRKKQETAPADVSALDLSAPPAGYTTTPRQVTQELPRYGSESIKQRPAWIRWARLSFLTALAIGLAMGVVVGGIYGLNEITSGDNATAPPPIVTFGTQSSEDTANQPALSPTATGVLINPPGTDDAVVLDGASAFLISFTAERRLWLEVVVDGNPVFRGILAPGAGFQETVTESVTVKTTNAGGLLLSINNEEFKLGEGRIEAEQTFTRDGLIIPTQPPPATPTAFASPTATWTMVLSLTATQDTTLLEASPSPTLFFTPALTPSSPTLTPFPTPSGSTPTPLPIPASPSPMFSPTFSPTPTSPFTATPSVTPSLTATPTIPATATPFLPPRETRTPTPDK